MTFDWTVSIGNVLTVIGFLGAAALFVFGMRGKLDLFGQRLVMIERQVGVVEKQLGKLSEAMIQLAVEKTRLDGISERVNALDRRWDELRHGVGFIVKPEA